MCRQYNDYGSATRDKQERNLNSLDFPEFQPHVDGDPQDHNVDSGRNAYSMPTAGRNKEGTNAHSMMGMKKTLMEIADFERANVQLALQQLRQTLQSSATMDAIQVFVNVTDLFGQLYVVKDIASRVKTEAYSESAADE